MNCHRHHPSILSHANAPHHPLGAFVGVQPTSRQKPCGFARPLVRHGAPSRLVGSGNGALDTGFSLFAPCVLQECLTASPCLGFHPLPPRTGREVFPHPAPDSLPLGAFKALSCSASHGLSHQAGLNSALSWLTSIVCAGVVVICLWAGSAPEVGTHRHLPPRSTRPTGVLVITESLSTLMVQQQTPPPQLPTRTGVRLDFAFRLIPAVSVDGATDRARPPLFHRLLSQHPALPTPEGALTATLPQGLHHLPVAFCCASPATGSPLVPRGPTFRRCKIDLMLRAAAWLPIPGHQLLQHIQSPDCLDACYVTYW